MLVFLGASFVPFCIFFAQSLRYVSGGPFLSRSPGSYRWRSLVQQAYWSAHRGRKYTSKSNGQGTLLDKMCLSRGQTKCPQQQGDFSPLCPWQPQGAKGNEPAPDGELSRSSSKAHGDASEPLRFSWNQFLSPGQARPGLSPGEV